MTVYIILFVIIAIPVGLLIWRRHGSAGADGTDPWAHKNIGVSGPPTQEGPLGSGGPG